MQKVFTRWIQTAAILLAVMLFGANTGLAQVAVSFGDVTGRPGETAAVAVKLSGVESGAAIQSFDFTVSTGVGITFTGISDTGSLAGIAQFQSGFNTANGAVGGFSTGTDITTSGTLVYISFSLDSTSAGSFSLTGFTLNGGDPTVTGSFTADYTVSERIIAVGDVSIGTDQDFVIQISLEDALLTDDAVIAFDFTLNFDPALMSVDKTVGVRGVVNSGTLTASAFVSGNDGPTAGTYRVAGFSGPAIVGDGLFIEIAATALSTAGTGTLSMTGLVFNDGTPIYAPRSGEFVSLPFNFPPVFTKELTDQSMLEDAGLFSFTYEATDANGDAITYSVSGGGTIDATTGVFTFDPNNNAGTNTIVVTASDSEETATTSATITVAAVRRGETILSGVHEPGGVLSPGSGWAESRLVESDDLFEIYGQFWDLSASFAAAHIHVGGIGVAGPVVIPLTVTAGNTDREGYFDMTIDLATVAYPSGMTQAEFVTELLSGGTYVNIHSAAHGAGELRGQLLAAGNTAPGAATLRGPSSVVIAGDPGAALFSLSWLPVDDPEGNDVVYLFELAADAAFTDNVLFEHMGDDTGFEVTVAEAAELFDMISGGSPGMIDVGGSVTVYQRVISSDGALWTVGPTDELTLTRGIVTDTETESELPTEFVLKGNYPNPFNPTTTIQFDLPETAEVSVQVIDLLGRQVLSVPAQTMDAGADVSIQLNASSLASGIYMYRVSVVGVSTTRVKVGTMTLLK